MKNPFIGAEALESMAIKKNDDQGHNEIVDTTETVMDEYSKLIEKYKPKEIE